MPRADGEQLTNTGTAGKITNCQLGVFLASAGAKSEEKAIVMDAIEQYAQQFANGTDGQRCMNDYQA